MSAFSLGPVGIEGERRFRAVLGARVGLLAEREVGRLEEAVLEVVDAEGRRLRRTSPSRGGRSL